MAKVLSFFQSDQKTEHFVLFKSKSCPEIFRLSPQVMELHDNLYLIDLNSSWSYWEKISNQQGNHLTTLLEEILIETYGKEKLYVFATHPFQAYLLYKSIEKKGGKGFYHAETKVIQNLYQALTWKHWCQCANDFNHIFESYKTLTRERKQAASQISRMEKLFTSLGVKTLKEVEQLDFDDLQRRFSSYIGLLWKWTFPHKFVDDEAPLFQFALDVSMLDFPWFGLKLAQPPKVKRHLEFPLTDWDHLKPQLEEDFVKLSRLKDLLPPYRVIEFLWKIVLYDLEECSVPIHFKFPICLEKEKEQEFSSLMTQFQFAFEEINQQIKERYQETDHINCAYIIGWDLSVTQKIFPTLQSNSLFDTSFAKEIKFEEFQNKIKNPLQRFETLDVSIPSLNFLPYNQNEKEKSTIFQLQPFYLLPCPIKISLDDIKQKRFLERTSAPWWNEDTPQNSYRDYYICELKDHLIYAFRNYLGDWYQHGIFS